MLPSREIHRKWYLWLHIYNYKIAHVRITWLLINTTKYLLVSVGVRIRKPALGCIPCEDINVHSFYLILSWSSHITSILVFLINPVLTLINNSRSMETSSKKLPTFCPIPFPLKCYAGQHSIKSTWKNW